MGRAGQGRAGHSRAGQGTAGQGTAAGQGARWCGRPSLSLFADELCLGVRPSRLRRKEASQLTLPAAWSLPYECVAVRHLLFTCLAGWMRLFNYFLTRPVRCNHVCGHSSLSLQPPSTHCEEKAQKRYKPFLVNNLPRHSVLKKCTEVLSLFPVVFCTDPYGHHRHYVVSAYSVHFLC